MKIHPACSLALLNSYGVTPSRELLSSNVKEGSVPEQDHDENLLASTSLNLLPLPLGGSALELEGWLDMYDAADTKPTDVDTAAQHSGNVAGKLHQQVAYPQLPCSPVPQAAAGPAPQGPATTSSKPQPLQAALPEALSPQKSYLRCSWRTVWPIRGTEAVVTGVTAAWPEALPKVIQEEGMTAGLLVLTIRLHLQQTCHPARQACLAQNQSVTSQQSLAWAQAPPMLRPELKPESPQGLPAAHLSRALLQNACHAVHIYKLLVPTQGLPIAAGHTAPGAPCSAAQCPA